MKIQKLNQILKELFTFEVQCDLLTVHFTSLIPIKWEAYYCLEYEIKDVKIYLTIKPISSCLFLKIF